MPPKQCPADREFFEKEYTHLEKSVRQISKEFGYSETIVWKRINKLGIARSISQANLGERNGMWKGDKVGYNSLHLWIKYHKQKSDLCEQCNKKSPKDLANLSGVYNRDIKNYNWLCRSCHMKMDYRLGRRIPGGKEKLRVAQIAEAKE